MCGGIKGWVGGGVWFLRSNCIVWGVCEGWGLRIELEVEIGCSAVGVLVGRQDARELKCMCVCMCAFAVVRAIRGALFSVSVEVCDGRLVCDGLLGVLLSCILGWGVIMGLTRVMFVVHT